MVGTQEVRVTIWRPKIWILPQTPTLLSLSEGKRHVLAGDRGLLGWNLYCLDHILSSQQMRSGSQVPLPPLVATRTASAIQQSFHNWLMNKWICDGMRGTIARKHHTTPSRSLRPLVSRHHWRSEEAAQHRMYLSSSHLGDAQSSFNSCYLGRWRCRPQDPGQGTQRGK